MQYFIDRTTNTLWAYEDDVPPSGILAGLDPITTAEYQAIQAQLALARLEAINTSLLDSKQRQATVQISAIQSRIDAINYLINTGDPDHPDYLEPDDPDYMAPTAAELAELPVRKAQLKAWNTYRGKLGRVMTSAGWYQTPAWPLMPEPYTSEMSATAPSAS